MGVGVRSVRSTSRRRGVVENARGILFYLLEIQISSEGGIGTHCWRDRAGMVLVDVVSPEATVRVKGRRVRERDAILIILESDPNTSLVRN